jgi:hypothetical protein
MSQIKNWKNELYDVLAICWADLRTTCEKPYFTKILQLTSGLRSDQAVKEKQYFSELQQGNDKKARALELIGLYHLVKVTEMIAEYLSGKKEKIDFQKVYWHLDQPVKVNDSSANHFETELPELINLTEKIKKTVSGLVEMEKD